MDSQVSHAYSLSSITLFLHRGQYSSIPAARHLSWTRHSFFRHPGHSAQPPFIRAFSSLCSIFPSLFADGLPLVCVLYIALYRSSKAAPVFPGGGRVPPQNPETGEPPTTTPPAANRHGSQAAGCFLHNMDKHTAELSVSTPQLNKITILLILQNPETIGNQGFFGYAYYPVPKFA